MAIAVFSENIVRRLAESLADWIGSARLLLKMGEFAKAGSHYLKAGDRFKAVNCFQDAEEWSTVATIWEELGNAEAAAVTASQAYSEKNNSSL